MKISLAYFGKAKSNINDEVSRYAKRLPGVLDIVSLKESALTGEDKLRKEAEAFDKQFPAGKFVRIVLAEEGEQLNTKALSERLNSYMSRNVVFLIGSAYGIDGSVKQSANMLLSLSMLTFAHDHALLIAAEQIYRCLMLLKGHPYHHE